jgi:GT2 family glycosyltransferase
VPAVERARAAGKFLFVGNRKLYVRGVTYGTFRPGDDGAELRDPGIVERDLADMAANGFNALRTYTVPPRWLLDLAHEHRLGVLVGLPWEQHVTFLDDRRRARSIEERVRAGVRACAGHPAVLCYAVGNEIPAAIVRWSGPRNVERFVERLYRGAKDEDPEGLVTYVNYPSTEYLQLPFLDLACFNVYLEAEAPLRSYLARLQNLVGDRPLMLGEVGLDSRRHGEEAQAETLEWQLRSTFAAGCAGAFVFSWTDEWHRGGCEIEDWDFGVTDRARRPKRALAAVRRAFAALPFGADVPWPRVSVVVCVANAETTIRECLAGLARLEYPDFEVLVVDDGSRDATLAIAREVARGTGFRVISSSRRGLAAARNKGLRHATGEIVAYIDGDAHPDPQWLTYLAATFREAEVAGAGGPNLPPPDGDATEACVARAPGGPVHVLLSDREAEHIPGCNMAFRRSALEAIGGFDPRFETAGDDVDVCWRLQERGWTLGFSPAAVVWHRPRASVRAYWRQQKGYGRAEALLEAKWPEKYNALGHLSWNGRIYRNGPTSSRRRSARIHFGRWGGALFQSLYQPAPGVLSSVASMPEWWLLILVLLGLSSLAPLWSPLWAALPLLAGSVAASLLTAARGARRSLPATAAVSRRTRLRRWAVIAWLHVLQPLARLQGRLAQGLHPWRVRNGGAFVLPRPRRGALWSERWSPPESRIQSLLAALRSTGAVVRTGGDHDRWDLEARGAGLGGVRLLVAVEEHGAGRQMVRMRAWPRCSPVAAGAVAAFAALSAAAGLSAAWIPAGLLGLVASLLAARAWQDCGGSMALVLHAFAAEAAACGGAPAPPRDGVPAAP